MVRQNPGSDTFHASLPLALPVGSSFEYRIHAKDGAVNTHRVVSPSVGWHAMSIVENLLVDFEAHDGGWTHQALLTDRADGWQLASVTNHTAAGSHAWRCQTVSAP